MRRPFFWGKMEKNGEKKPTQKKVNAHFVNTNTIRNHIALVLFVVVMALARETTRAAESDEMKTMKKKNENAAVSTQFSDGASSVFFPLLGDAATGC